MFSEKRGSETQLGPAQPEQAGFTDYKTRPAVSTRAWLHRARFTIHAESLKEDPLKGKTEM